MDAPYNGAVPDPIAHLRRLRRALWTPILFLSLFLAAVAAIAVYWVLPMVRAAQNGTPADRQRAVAYGVLVLILLLFLLLVGLLASFRFSTWAFFSNQRKPTQYVDIWKEAGKRAKTPDAEELEEG